VARRSIQTVGVPRRFEDRLKKSGMAEKITAILKPHGEYIRSIYFDVDDGREEVRTDPADTYSLRIYVLYTTESDPGKAQDAAENVQAKIETAFRQKLFNPSQRWLFIELCECTVVSDDGNDNRTIHNVQGMATGAPEPPR
jgi:hypothetical protein